MIVYPDNPEIQLFVLKAQNKIADLSTLYVKRGGNLPDSLSLLLELSDFIECLDDRFNIFEEEDIIRWIHYYNHRANLNNITYLEMTGIEVNVIVSGLTGNITTANISDFDSATTALINQALTGLAVGDMVKAVYDTNNNGIVDNCETLNGQSPAYYLTRTNHTGQQTASTISDFSSAANNALSTALSNKVDKVSGKQLSSEDYTTLEKNKLAGIAPNATAYSDSLARAAQLNRVSTVGTTTITLLAESPIDYRTFTSGSVIVDGTNAVVGKVARFVIAIGVSAPSFVNAPSGQPYKYVGATYTSGKAWNYMLLVCADRIEVLISPD